MLRHVDLFCGVGGFHKALEGTSCILANDISKECSQTYKANFEAPFRLCNVSDIEELPECDVLTAGFPCQPFSVAGERKGFDDDRGQMFFQIIRLLEIVNKRPAIILLENVKGILTNDEGRFRLFWNIFKMLNIT